MSERFVIVDRDTPMLLPPSLQDWLPEGHLAHFVVETVALLPLHGFQVNTRGTGSAQMPPSMMLSLLIYNYAVGRMSSRQIEKATYEDVASRTTVRFRTPVNTVVFHHQQVESVTLVDKKPAKWAFSRKA